jgi:hypothetical protein
MYTLMLCALLASIQDTPGKSPYSHANLPAHGTLYQQRLYGLFSVLDSQSAIFAEPVDKPTQRPWNGGFRDAKLHFRHHIAGGALWTIAGPERVYRVPFDKMHALDSSRMSSWALPSLGGKYAGWQVSEQGAGGDFYFRPPTPLKALAGIDFLPVTENTCRVFYFVKSKRRIETWETQGGYDKKEKRWVTVADDRNPETIPSSFIEDFYVFERKGDYYFVTQSGKLYIAPARKDGEESRSMKDLWVDAKRPIVAVIVDADNDKVWLFAKEKNAGAKLDHYFEMKDTIETRSFDPKKLAPVNVEGRAKLLLEYLPLITKKGS